MGKSRASTRKNYDPGEWARFEVHLTKARGVFGEDALAFEAKLELDEDGAARWVCTDLKSEDAEDVQKVLELSEAGKSTREIGKELSMSKSRVDRLLKKPSGRRKPSRRSRRTSDPCPAVPLP